MLRTPSVTTKAVLVPPLELEAHRGAMQSEFQAAAAGHAAALAREPFEVVSARIRQLAPEMRGALRDVCLAADRLAAYCSTLSGLLDVFFPSSIDGMDSMLAPVRTAQQTLQSFSATEGVVFRRLRWVVAQSYLARPTSASSSRQGRCDELEAANWWPALKLGEGRRPSTVEGILLRAAPWCSDGDLIGAWRAHLLPCNAPGVLDQVAAAIQWVWEAGMHETPPFIAERLQLLCSQRTPQREDLFLLAESPDNLISTIAARLGLRYTPISLYASLKPEQKRLIGGSRRWVDRRGEFAGVTSTDIPVRLDRLFLQDARSATYYAGSAVFVRPLAELQGIN